MKGYGRVVEPPFFDQDATECKISEITVSDIDAIVDIISKLYITENEHYLDESIKSLDALLDVSGSVLGVYNTKSHSIEFVTSSSQEIHSYNAGTQDYLSKKGRIFFDKTLDDSRAFVSIDTKSTTLSKRRSEIINIVLPHLLSGVLNFHAIRRDVLEMGLTCREMEVLRWMAEGKDNWSISKILGVSERTIKFHNGNIYRKLGVATKAEAISRYLGKDLSKKGISYK